MSIEERLQQDMKEAMRSGEKQRLNIIRMARAALQSAHQEVVRQRSQAAIQQIEARLMQDAAIQEAENRRTAIDAALSAELADMEAELRAPIELAAQETVIRKEIKQRQDAAELYRKGGHEERAAQEEADVQTLASYLPKQMSADELRPEVAALIAELGLGGGQAAMGKLMPVLQERFKGRAENRTLSQLARELLAKG